VKPIGLRNRARPAAEALWNIPLKKESGRAAYLYVLIGREGRFEPREGNWLARS
jgi:hypothetical protein